MLLRRYYALSFVMLSLGMAAPAAMAEDGKAMPGSACQATFASGIQPLFRGAPSILSSGSTNVSVTCPVAKDIEAGRIKRAEVMVIDRNPAAGADISCTLSTFKKDGTVQQSETKKSNSSFTTALPISFGAQTAAVQGSYSLVCDLPAFAPSSGPSAIVMYNVVEE
jgi:hypothetical protein